MQWIKDIVTGLIETYDTRDIYELLNCLEVIVIKKSFLSSNIKARLYKDPFENYYIYVSTELNDYELKVVLCHELGHIILHDITCDYYYNSNLNKGKLEMQANYFASLLLLDENTFEKCYLEDLSLDQLSSYFAVPKELIEYRLGDVI